MPQPPEHRAPEILGSGPDSPRPRERWAALPRRTRRLTLAAAGAAVLAAGTWYGIAAHPARQQPPLPYPAQTTHVGYLWTSSPAPQPAPREPSFVITLRADADSPVTIEHIEQGYAGLTLTPSPPLPLRVTPDRPRTVSLEADVTRCAGLPRAAGLPFLDITLRNTRARQTLSVIPGDRYARDLARAFRTVCGPHNTAATPTR